MRILLMIVSGLLIVFTLLQGGNADGLSAAFTGSGDLNLFSVRKECGSEAIYVRITSVLVVVFFILIFYLNSTF